MAVRRRGERPFALTRKQDAGVEAGEDSAWREMPFSDAVLVNPPVTLRKGEHYSFVEMKDLVPNDRYVRPSRERELTGGSRFYTRDTLFARITPCLENGKIAQVIGLEGGAGFGSTEFIVMRGKPCVTDTDFVHYLSISEPVRRHAEMSMSGTSGRQRVDVSAFDKLFISLPPLPVQKRIAEILGALDDKMECNRRINVTLENMAMALYKHWFVDFGPFRSGKFVDSEVGRIPEGWELCSLHESANYINGAAFKNHDFSPDNSGLPVIKISELKSGITPQTKFCDKDLDPKYKITCGDILFSWSGQPETSIDIFLWSEAGAWLNQHTFRVIPHVEEQKCFVFFLLKYLKPNFIEIARNKQTTGLGHVTIRDMQRMKVVFPSRLVLEQFNQIAYPLFEQILRNKKEEQTLARTRDYLLPKLLSGEISVDVNVLMGNGL